MLAGMTSSADPTATVLRAYAEHPLADGDAVLLVDDAACLELTGLADEWDDDLRTGLTRALREASRVVVAIARDGAALRPSDYQLWRDLHAGLRGTDVALQPVRALPAA